MLPGATPMEAMRWLAHDRPGRRGRGGDPRPAAGDDGRRDRRAGRHALRPRRAGAPRRGDDRPAGQRGRAVLHPAGAGLLPARAAPGCRRWAGPASRSGTWCRSGTTRAFPATTCSWRSGPTSSEQLSTYQTSLGSVGANVEGWALYAERLMDELGYFTDPGERLGYLDAQQLRAVRVVIDIGMHLRAADPRRRRGLAGRAPRASRGRRSWRGRSWARTPAPTSPSSTASWSATSASPGRRSATSWGSGPGWRAGRRRGRPAAPTSTSRPGTWRRCRRARSASTTWPPSSRSSSGRRCGERECRDRRTPDHAEHRPRRAEPGPGVGERERHEPEVGRADAGGRPEGTTSARPDRRDEGRARPAPPPGRPGRRGGRRPG